MTNENTFDPAIQSENIAFSPDEMATCGKCGRKNAPDRPSCIYCGERLAAGVESLAEGRAAEDWEPAFNVIITGGGTATHELANAASVHGVGLPFARLAESQDADATAAELGERGISVRVVPDSLLAVEWPPVRLSSIEFGDRELRFADRNTGEVTVSAIADIALVVIGILFSSRVDTMEKRKRGADAKRLDESTATDHEPVIDIYVAGDARGFRVSCNGFDFRCLGDEMTMFAAKNMTLLVEHLRRVLPDAKFVECYRELRPLLETVWPTTIRREAQGIVRSGLGQKGFGRSEISSNAEQFDRFSRTQFHIL